MARPRPATARTRQSSTATRRTTRSTARSRTASGRATSTTRPASMMWLFYMRTKDEALQKLDQFKLNVLLPARARGAAAGRGAQRSCRVGARAPRAPSRDAKRRRRGPPVAARQNRRRVKVRAAEGRPVRGAPRGGYWVLAGGRVLSMPLIRHVFKSTRGEEYDLRFVHKNATKIVHLLGKVAALAGARAVCGCRWAVLTHSRLLVRHTRPWRPVFQ